MSTGKSATCGQIVPKIRVIRDFYGGRSVQIVFTTRENMKAYQAGTEAALNALIKRRTVLNLRKKQRQKLYAALADAEALAGTRTFHEDGIASIEDAIERYENAVSVLEKSGINRETLAREKAELYEEIAAVNREIREQRKKLAMCAEILSKTPEIEENLQKNRTEAAGTA